MFTVIITLAVIACIFGLILAYSAIRFKVEGDQNKFRSDFLKIIFNSNFSVLSLQSF